MSDEKDKDLTTNIVLADILLRLTVLENLLIKKGVFTKEEAAALTEEISQATAKVVLEKVQQSKTLNEFISSLKGEKKPPTN